MTGRRSVIAISGEPAAGKTTAAALLAEIVDGLTIDTDLLSAPLRDAALSCLGMSPRDVDTPFFRDHLRPAVYRCLTDTAVHLSQFGRPVIISAPFHPSAVESSFWESFQVEPAGVDAELLRIHVSADAVAVRTRMARCGEPRDAGKLADWDSYRGTWLAAPEPGVATVVNDGTLDDLREALRAAVSV